MNTVKQRIIKYETVYNSPMYGVPIARTKRGKSEGKSTKSTKTNIKNDRVRASAEAGLATGQRSRHIHPWMDPHAAVVHEIFNGFTLGSWKYRKGIGAGR